MARTRTAQAVGRHRITILKIAFLVILPLLVFTRPAYSGDELVHEVAESLGMLFVIAGVLGRFWSTLYSGGRKNQTVVQDGPYSMCRHPLYFFSTVAMIGFGLMTGSLVLLLVITGVTFAVLWNTARNEEEFLRGKFGADYAAFADRVPAIIPNPFLFSTPRMVTFDVTQLRRNLRDAVGFLSLLPIAEFLEFLHESAEFPTIAIW